MCLRIIKNKVVMLASHVVKIIGISSSGSRIDSLDC